MLHCKLLRSTHPARAHRPHRHVTRARRIPASTSCSPATTSRFRTASCRSARTSTRSAIDRVRFVGDPVAAVIARDELTAVRGARPDRRRVRAAAHVRDPGRQPRASPSRASTTTATPATSTSSCRCEFGDVDAGARRRRPRVRGHVLLRGQHAPADRAARRGRGQGSRRQARRSGRARRRRTTSTARWPRRSRMPAAHIRVIATPNGGGFGGKSDPFNHEIVVAKAALLLDRPVKICLTREEVFYCHRGRHPVLMQFQTGVKSDGTITGMHLQTLLDGGAYGSLRRRQHVLHRRAADRDLPHPALPASRAAASSPTSRRAARSAGTARRRARFGQEVQLDKIAERLGIDPAELRLRIVAQPDTLTANYLRVGTIGLAECIRRVVERLGLERTASASCRTAAASASPARRISRGAGLPIYWNDMPHSGVQLKLDRSGGVTAFCGATEIGQGSDDVLVAMRGGGARHRSVRHPRGHRRHRSDAGRSRLLFEPRHADDGQRRDPGGRARARAARRRRCRRSSSVPEDRAGVRRAPRLRRREPGRRASASAEAVVPGRGEVRHDRHDRLVHAAAIGRRSSRAAASGRRRPTPTPPPSSKSRSIPRPAGSTCRASGSRTTSAARSTRRSSRGQVEGSVYMGARRSADGGAGVPPPAAAAVARARAQVPVDARIQEPDDARHAGGRARTWSRIPIRDGPFGAKEVGQGPLLPVMPAVANAVYDAVGVRDRRGADHAGEDPAARSQAKAAGKPARVRPGARSPTSPGPSRCYVPPPWEGGDGTRHRTSREAHEAQGRGGIEADRGRCGS